MKQNISITMGIIALALGIAIGIVGSFGFAKNANGLEYPLTTVVAELNEDTNEVICMDFNGNKWTISDTDYWAVGDVASLIMNDNGTEIIYDDKIVTARYCGWIDGHWGWNGDFPVLLLENN